MKKLILIFTLFYLVFFHAYSQNFDGCNFTPFQVGLFFVGKGCINAVEPPQGLKNDFQLSRFPDFGGKFTYQFQPNSSTKLIFDVSYLSVYYKLKLYNNASINWVNEFHYLNFGLGFEFSSMFISINLGIPTTGAFSSNSSTGKIDLKTEEMNTMLQLRFGGSIPISSSEIGSFNFLIYGDYFLIGALAQESNYYPRIASLSIGLSYMFKIK